MNLHDLLDRPIAFQRVFVSIGVGIGGALMLSQAVYWSKRTKNADGWFYKTQDEWEEETGMTRTEQERARKALCAIGVMSEKRRGIPAKLFFRVDFDELSKALAGELREITLEDLKRDFATVLSRLSKTSLMTAKKVKPAIKTEHVDFLELLTAHGMTCGICSEAINYGPGNHSKALVFAHKKILAHGGGHLASNIVPAHFMCKEMKDADDYQNPSMSTADTLGELQPSMSTADILDGLHKTDSRVLGNQSITETTAETTAETTDTSEGGTAAPTSPGALVATVEVQAGPRFQIPDDMPGPKDPACKTFKAWANYAFAYRKRYSAWPVWNAKAGGQLGQLIARLGAENSHHVAAYYLTVNDAFLIRKCHDLASLVRDAEAFHTQWATNRQMNGTTARQLEQTQANINAAHTAAESIRSKEGKRNAFL